MKNLRTGPQVRDQSFDHSFNAALKTSLRTGKVRVAPSFARSPSLTPARLTSALFQPVRVIRGYKNDSAWSPSIGFRYDGLYQVVDALMVRLLVCSRLVTPRRCSPMSGPSLVGSFDRCA